MKTILGTAQRRSSFPMISSALRCGAAALALTAATRVEAQVVPQSDPQATGSKDPAQSSTQSPNDSAQSSTQSATVGEIVVTGTRAGNGFRAPTPTNTLPGQELQTLQATNVAAALQTVPSFKASNSPSGAGLRANAPGVAQADLRGLGANRTLLLINGERVVPNAPTNVAGTVVIAPDLNAVPELLIDHVDLVTGGASAQWGSDAMAGVINLVLRRHYNGVQVTAQSGISQYRDASEVRAGVLAGTDLAGDRLHVLGALDYTKDDPIHSIYSRPWGREEIYQVANPGYATNGLPAILISPGVHLYSTTGGLITGPANFSLRNYTFNPDGSLSPFTVGSNNNGTFQIGGDGRAITADVPQTPEVRRVLAAGHIEYNLSPNTNAFVDASYADVQGHIFLAPFRDTGTVIRSDNAFLPPAVATALAAAHLTSFTLNRINADIGGLNEVFSKNRTPRLTGGLDGHFGTWKWDAHVTYSENIYHLVTPHDRIASNYAFARDAVLYNGQVVCRATIPGPSFNAAAAGCVPIDIFGAGAPSAAAVNYVTGTSDETSRYHQLSAAANLSGEPFSTWAGPVSVGTGVEYRRESQSVVADPISLTTQFQYGATSAFSGSFDVKEGYVETIVPLARDLPFLHALDLNGAVRYAEYSTVGGSTTWKIGAVWEPIVGLRLRATRSRDLRAPALYELLTKGSVQNLNLTVKGQSVNIPGNVNIGNPDLRPETGNTFTAGFVIEPRSLPGFHFSADYYDIRITDAITTVTPSTLASLCSGGQTAFCNAFTFNAAGVPTSLNFSIVNAASLRNEGLDVVASYHVPVGQGQLSLSASGTYVRHVYVNVGFGGATIDRAGEDSNFNNYSLPRFRGTLLSTYSVGILDLSAQLNFISAGTLDNTFNSTPALTVTTNHVPAYTYLNLFMNVRLGQGDRWRFFTSVNNVFNKAPPAIPNTGYLTITNGQYYDLVGRSFRAGVALKF